MAMRRRNVRRQAADSIEFAGRRWPVIERRTVGGRVYLVLEKLSTNGRQRYLVFDPFACPGGDFRVLLVLPKSAAALQHVRVLKRLSTGNSNLPTILEYRNSRDEIALVTTWVKGSDLRRYLDIVRVGKMPRPSPNECLRLVRGLAHGVSQLHRRQTIVHGDLKPANLIVARDPTRLVMIDFGSAWFVSHSICHDQGDGLSRIYAAPEMQAGTEPVDFRSDQFSASVILYEMLTLQRPYDQLGGQAGLPGIESRMRDSLIPPSRLSPDRGRLTRDFWKELDRLTMKGLALAPDDRFSTPTEWLDALDRLHSSIRPRSLRLNERSRWTRVIEWIFRRQNKQ